MNATILLRSVKKKDGSWLSLRTMVSATVTGKCWTRNAVVAFLTPCLLSPFLSPTIDINNLALTKRIVGWCCYHTKVNLNTNYLIIILKYWESNLVWKINKLFNNLFNIYTFNKIYIKYLYSIIYTNIHTWIL